MIKFDALVTGRLTEFTAGMPVTIPRGPCELEVHEVKGVWTDDAWGPDAWAQWTDQMQRVLPGAQYAFHDLPLDNQLFRAQFDVKVLPQIPSIQHWRQFGGPGAPTSERGEDSAVPWMRAIADATGNLMVVSTHNTDITDAWEREG